MRILLIIFIFESSKVSYSYFNFEMKGKCTSNLLQLQTIIKTSKISIQSNSKEGKQFNLKLQEAYKYFLRNNSNILKWRKNTTIKEFVSNSVVNVYFWMDRIRKELQTFYSIVYMNECINLNWNYNFYMILMNREQN